MLITFYYIAGHVDFTFLSQWYYTSMPIKNSRSQTPFVDSHVISKQQRRAFVQNIADLNPGHEQQTHGVQELFVKTTF